MTPTELSRRQSVEQGTAVLGALLASGIDVSAACWLRREVGDWWFVVVSKTAGEMGTRETHLKAFEVLNRLGLPAGQRSLLRIARPREHLGREVLAMASRQPEGGPNYTGAVAGHEIAEIYLYPVGSWTTAAAGGRSNP
ncbi:MAG: hypothetical protein ACRC33_06660 [Gemmataceae bacterium]